MSLQGGSIVALQMSQGGSSGFLQVGRGGSIQSLSMQASAGYSPIISVPITPTDSFYILESGSPDNYLMEDGFTYVIEDGT